LVFEKLGCTKDCFRYGNTYDSLKRLGFIVRLLQFTQSIENKFKLYHSYTCSIFLACPKLFKKSENSTVVEVDGF
jgi:hypothetical protein